MSTYTKIDFENLKFKFSDAEKIQQNYSQASQDMFVLTVLNGKQNGTYVEIGGYDGERISNTNLLETQFNWSGIALEIDSTRTVKYNSQRKNKCVCANALTSDYSQLFIDNQFSNRIDYLQVDIEPPINTLNALKKIPHDKYRFSVITFETDMYYAGDAVMNESRAFLTNLGYDLIAKNVSSFEDWYIDPTAPDIIQSSILDMLRTTTPKPSDRSVILFKS